MESSWIKSNTNNAFSFSAYLHCSKLDLRNISRSVEVEQLYVALNKSNMHNPEGKGKQGKAMRLTGREGP
jgi:hypothetical protein